MRYFGKKSLSSVMRIIFEIIWYILLAANIIAIIIFFIGEYSHSVINPYEYSGLIFSLDESIDIPKTLGFLGFPGLIFSLFIIWMFKELFKSFKKEEIFTKKNFNRFQLIGLSIIIYSLIDPFINYIKAKILLNIITVNNAEVKASFDVPGLIFVGLIILIIAEIFKEAVKLKEENDLTI